MAPQNNNTPIFSGLTQTKQTKNTIADSVPNIFTITLSKLKLIIIKTNPKLINKI